MAPMDSEAEAKAAEEADRDRVYEDFAERVRAGRKLRPMPAACKEVDPCRVRLFLSHHVTSLVAFLKPSLKKS